MTGDINILFVQWHLLVCTLFVISSLTFIIYYHSKENTFFYYFLYSFLVFTYLLLKTQYVYPQLDYISNPYYISINWYIQVLYYISYAYFVCYFLDLDELYPKLYGQINKLLKFEGILLSLLFVICIVFKTKDLYYYFFQIIFTPVMIAAIVYTFYTIRGIKGKLKHYVIIGTSIYAASALVSTILELTNFPGSPIVFFFFGLLIEQFIFSVGLAHKVKLISNEKIAQYEENQRIKSNQNKILNIELKKKEDEILKITEKAERERLSKVRQKFENEIQKLKLISLQNQMNPHFVFNVLNSIKLYLIENESHNAVYYLGKLSQLIRKILESTRLNEHSLKEELHILKLYLSIENIRFDQKLKIEFNIEESEFLNSLKIPPLILQAFAENALWHGLTSSEKEEKKLAIESYVENAKYILTITDNGIGRKKSALINQNKYLKKDSVGIKLTQQRIEYFNQDNHLNYRFYFTDLHGLENKPLGTKVTFVFDTLV